jgi:hypothetical protein
MIGIGKDDLRAEGFQRFLRQAFHRRRRAHRHKHRRFNHSMRRLQLPPPRTGRIVLQNLERKIHLISVSGEGERDSHAQHQINQKDSKNDVESFAALKFLGVYRRKTD